MQSAFTPFLLAFLLISRASSSTAFTVPQPNGVPSASKPVADEITTLAQNCHTLCAPVWKKMADEQLEAGDVRAARTSIGKALSYLREDQYSLDYASVLNTAALVDFADRQYARAERSWNRALAIVSSLRPNGHPTATIIGSHLALMRAMQGRYGEAEKLLLNAIAASGDQPEVVDYRDRLARTWILAGQYSKAENEARTGLELAARTIGVENARALPLWMSLGTAQASQRNFVEADLSLRRALTIAVNLYGAQHTFTGSVLREYSFVLKRAGRKREAKNMEKNANLILDADLKARANTIDVSERPASSQVLDHH